MATLLVSHHSFSCWTSTFFAAQHNVMEDIAENSEMFFRSCGDSSEPVPSTKAEPVDI